jgi:hypothetical protein
MRIKEAWLPVFVLAGGVPRVSGQDHAQTNGIGGDGFWSDTANREAGDEPGIGVPKIDVASIGDPPLSTTACVTLDHQASLERLQLNRCATLDLGAHWMDSLSAQWLDNNWLIARTAGGSSIPAINNRFIVRRGAELHLEEACVRPSRGFDPSPDASRDGVIVPDAPSTRACSLKSNVTDYC